MPKPLPKQPSLEHLKNEAKALLREAKAAAASMKLTEAQLAVAREYGFPSWTKLKRAVEGYPSQRDAFFAGIRAGDRTQVADLLDENPALIYAYDEHSFGARAIPAAASRNDKPMIELLLSRGADFDARSDWWAGSFGALDFADEDTSRFLISKGASLSAHAAARLGMVEELRQMLANKPSAVNERGGDGQTPLHFARTPEIVDILLDAGADIDIRDLDHEGTPAQTRVLDLPVLHRLVERGAKTDIFMAIALDDLELVRHYLDEDPDAIDRRTDEPGNPMIPKAPGHHIYTYNLGFVRPFQAAIKFGREEIYAFLFQRSPEGLRLVSACCKGDRDTVLGLLRENPSAADASDRDRSLLCDSGRSPNPVAVQLMLEAGFDVNTSDREGFTAIHWASFHGRDDMIELMLPYMPDLEKRNVYGGTVLTTGIYGSLNGWYRSEGNYGRSMELLIAAGAGLPEKPGGSPEVSAVLSRHIG